MKYNKCDDCFYLLKIFDSCPSDGLLNYNDF